MTSTSFVDQILGLEEETWQALQKSGPAMVPYISKDCIMQFPYGLKVTPETQPSVVDILHSEAFVPWKTYKLENVNVTPVGPGGAVISYLVIATRADGLDVSFEALCSSVWRQEDGQWLMCFHQQTLVT